MIIYKFGIWSLILGQIFGALIMVLLLYYSAPSFWQQIIQIKITNRFNWFKEVIILQGKYAVSWISGFFIFYLYVPLVNKYEGIIIAGQLGFTLTIVKSIHSISYSWIAAKIPKLNIMVAQKDYASLNSVFFTSFRNGLIVFSSISILFLVFIYISKDFTLLEGRILDVESTIYLILIHLIQLIIAFFAAYLRAFKKEPFYFLSILNALLIAGITFLVLKELGFLQMLIWISLAYGFIILPIGTRIFFNHFKKSI